jgi:hypothetical protein
MFFMQHMMDQWIEENNAGVLAGCMGEGATVSNVIVAGKKAASVGWRYALEPTSSKNL